ncbi:sugar transferase [uncultured Bacteroides sp.]|uniref:sugar transferase n=1 Tax=uncultured Bacteroides sp. TaxID=162156 RepID=UPI002AAAEBA1|nr:sugar transferase [uncultured Bacteroides sp.]
MQHLVYIGKNAQTATHFSRLSEGKMKVTQNTYEATQWLSQCDNKMPVIILFEKGLKKRDLADVSYLHNKFYHTSIVLITDSLTKDESILYLKSGICNTLSPNESKENFEHTQEFIFNRQHQFHTALQNQKSIEQFHLPLTKRIFDIIFSSIALICLSPLLILVAIAIRLESKGPVVYKSKRVGSNYRVFDFLKFRSMYSNADKRLKEFNNLNQYKSDQEIIEKAEVTQTEQTIETEEILLVSDDYIIPEQEYIAQKSVEKKNSFVKLENDPRITKVGRFIRKYSIDELPQLINILKGDMSIVGNRPLPLYEAELLTSDEYIDRFMAPAGLTGLWQVEKRGDAGKMSAEERKLLDIQYAKNYSFGMDMKIILKTATAFVQKENV